MQAIGKISILHVILLTMTFIGIKNHVTIIPSILREAGRDGWISVIAGGILLIPWFFVLLYIHKKTNQQPIKDWLTSKIGKRASKIILYAIAMFLIFLAAFTMIETLQWATTTFLPTTPIIALLIVYTLICIMLVTTDIQTIVIVNVFVLTGVLVLGFFVSYTNNQFKDHSLLFPLLEHGIQPVAKGMIYPMSGYVEVLIILFLQQHLKKPMRWYHFGIILALLIWLTQGPLIGSITEFGPDEAAKQRFPSYEEWGLASIGRFIEHLDFFSIYQWLTGALIRVSLLLYIVSDLFNIRGDKKRIWLIISPLFILMGIIILLFSERLFLDIKGDYLLITTFFLFFFFSFFLMFVSFLKNKQKI